MFDYKNVADFLDFYCLHEADLTFIGGQSHLASKHTF